MTNSWTDIKNADVILVMGGNAAEAHPCGFKWVTEAKHHNGAKFIVVDPRFNRSAAVADFYCPLRPGTDIAFLGGVINYLLSNDKIHHDYVRNYTNASYLIKDGFNFNAEEGLYVGYDAEKRTYNKSEWDYQLGPDGFALTDPTLQNPRSVFQLMKTHFSRYTPEMVERVCGSPKAKFLKVCEYIATTANGERAMTSMYALGWTQHSKGSQNIRSMAMIQLLLGNIGVPGGGVNALRGHSNVQGYTDIGVLSTSTPGYMQIGLDSEPTLEAHLARRDFRPLQPNQMSYWQNYKKFYVSYLKAMYGAKATPANNFGFDWAAKSDRLYDTMAQIDLMHQGKVNGFICQGWNPLLSVPNKAKLKSALSKLKFLVSIDPLETETVRFWENHGEYNDVDPTKIQTEVFMLPSTCFAEDEGSLTNSSRTILWHWAGASPPGEAKTDIDILAELYLKIRALYEKDGGKGKEPFLAVDWSYKNPHAPTPLELLGELNGRALTDIADPTDATKQLYKAGQLLNTFGHLKDDGSTASACWIYTGCYTEKGNMTARLDNADPSGLGVYGNWGFAWPVNRRILYNRASADPTGKPWSPRKKYITWDEAAKKWIGPDVPDYGPTIAPEKNVSPFIMNAEGVSRLFARGMMAEGPFPEHYEPFESPVVNPFHPKTQSNPAAKVYKSDLDVFGTAKDFPYVATTYRLTEHFHFWTKNNILNSTVQPQQFVELSEELAKEKGIKHGGWVRVWSNRGSIKAKAMVTKRIKPLMCDGKTVHTIGVPIHWGFVGAARKGFATNTLTPFVGDANTQAPEFKAFLVDIEPLTSGPATS